MKHYKSHFIILLAVLLPVMDGLAIDPLPPNLENASEEVQQEYLDRAAADSLERKLEVGQRRHAERTRYKQQLAHNQRVEALERRKARHAAAPRSPLVGKQVSKVSQSSFLNNLILIGMALGLAVFWLHERRKLNS